MCTEFPRCTSTVNTLDYSRTRLDRPYNSSSVYACYHKRTTAAEQGLTLGPTRRAIAVSIQTG